MRILIAVMSCHALRHQQDAIRLSWGKDVPEHVDLRFILAAREGAVQANDEVFLETGDLLQDLTHKVVGTYKWALYNGYDYVLKLDLDTFVVINNLLSSGFELYNYVGGQNSFFASGGAGYWLSKKAMEYVVAAEPEYGPAEDVHVARVLMQYGLTVQSDHRYKFVPGDILDANTITFHLSSVRGWNHPYNTGMMEQASRDFKVGIYQAYLVHPESRFKRRLGRA